MKVFVVPLLVSLAGPALATTPADQAGTDRAAACPRAQPTWTDWAGKQVPRRLGELPPANLHLTVLRSIGGCPMATIKVGNETRLVPLGKPERGLTPLDAPPHRR